MKLKFFILTFLLLFARGCDFYSTSLWFFDNPTGEQNLLYRFFNFGWSGLIISNIIIVSAIIYAFYYYTFKYKKAKTKIITNIKILINTLDGFTSELANKSAS